MVSAKAWAEVPQIAKQAAIGSSLQLIDEYARLSAAAGGFDRSEAHLSRTRVCLDAKGWDLALRYKLGDTAWGTWTAGFDGTYIAQWDNDVDTTNEADEPKHLAGTYHKDYGNYSRIRARAFSSEP